MLIYIFCLNVFPICAYSCFLMRGQIVNMRIFSHRQFYLRFLSFLGAWFAGCFLSHILCNRSVELLDIDQITTPYRVSPFAFAAMVLPGVLVWIAIRRQRMVIAYAVCFLKAFSFSLCLDLVFRSCGDAGFLCSCFVLLPQFLLMVPLWFLFICLAHCDTQYYSGIILFYFLFAGFLFLIQGAVISPFYLKLFSSL